MKSIMIRSMQLHNTRSHTSSGIMASTEESVDDVGEGEATGGLEVTTVTTDIGISLRVSPDQASLGVLSDESLQGGAGQFSLLVEGILTQPAGLGSSCERGVTVGSHQVPGLQELHCNNNNMSHQLHVATPTRNRNNNNVTHDFTFRRRTRQTLWKHRPCKLIR